jgi:hypothetical protein
MIQSILRTLIIIFCFIVFLAALVFFIRVVIYKPEPDPIEEMVSQSLGNKDLVLGSKLKLWVNTLGEPNLIAISGSIVKGTEYYWTNRGIGVQVDGEWNGNLSSTLDKRISVIIIPVERKTASEFMQYTKIISPKAKSGSTIEFDKLLDFKMDDLDVRNITESDIYKYYENYDASNDVYYHKQFPFSEVSVKVWRNNGGCAGPRCKTRINIIEIGDADMFDIANFLAGIKRMYLFGKVILQYDQTQPNIEKN